MLRQAGFFERGIAARQTGIAHIEQMAPLARIGRPEEAAGAAASYVIGHSMIVDGGMTAWAHQARRVRHSPARMAY